MSERRVIAIGGPGLGDSLSYSTLPEELTRQHGYEVWIRPPFHPWRNTEVRALWERNPYVAGFTDDPGSDFEPWERREARSYRSWILGMENAYGCHPTNEWPRLYGPSPQFRPECGGKVYIDPRSSSQAFPAHAIEVYVAKVGHQLGFDPASVIVVESPYSAVNGADALADNPREIVRGLDEYASVVTSCAVFMTVESGGHMFASAVKGARLTPHVTSLFSVFQFNDKVFRMSNVDYKITSAGEAHRDW